MTLQLFDRTKFKGERLENRTFRRCRFNRCSFEYAIFVDCDFSFSSFFESALDVALFERCNFSHCTFERCDFVGSKFTGCGFDHISFAEEAEVQRDFERVLVGWINEIPGLVTALKNGHFDGCGHDGECVDLMATLHRIRRKKYKPPFIERPSPADLWLLSIAKGDMPGDPTPAGYAAARAVESAETMLQKSTQNHALSNATV